ncbi:MAG: hypothetical protein JWL65_7219 [Gammaproteobacteria bacterium]|nr:hypothetical protein [Gammaproteobacteria bacterium]
MQVFAPALHIASVDHHDAAVIFDSGAANDYARAVKTVRVPRSFTEMSIQVSEFVEMQSEPTSTMREYSGSIVLHVKGADEREIQYVLAEPRFRLEAERTRGKPPLFPSTGTLTQTVRQGVAAAFGRALAGYQASEAQMDAIARLPAGRLPIAAESLEHRGATITGLGGIAALEGPTHTATDSVVERTRFRNRVIAAVVISPLVVFALLSFVGKKHDPIAEAVAKSMVEDPQSLASRVQLATATMKAMGLDPGKSGELGCLAQSR